MYIDHEQVELNDGNCIEQVELIDDVTKKNLQLICTFILFLLYRCYALYLI